MKKLILTKVIASTLVAFSVLTLNPIGASAEWKQDSTGWWYTEGNSWATGWRQIDGKWYYFDSNGYMAHDTVIGTYKVGADGTWINEAVKTTSEVITPVVAKEEDFDFDASAGKVTKYKGKDASIIIPSTIKGIAVKTIGQSSFFNCNTLKSVTIPDGVVTIEDGAFAKCENLVSVTIPNSVKTIMFGAFSMCYSLTSATIPSSVTTIGEWVFDGDTSLSELTIPSTLNIDPYKLVGANDKVKIKRV